MLGVYSLNTKQKRLELRKSWIRESKTEIYKDIEILQKEKDTEGCSLVIWKGTAGMPYINYYWKSQSQNPEARINDIITYEKKRADKRDEYKKNNKKGKYITQAAKASKTIKTILKKEYPEIKFSVRSDNFANGSSVNVSWTDGIPDDTLRSFLNQFEYGHFDGMEDLYHYSNVKDMPQAKFVSGQRSISKDKENIIRKQLADFVDISENDYNTRIEKHYVYNGKNVIDFGYLNNAIHRIAVYFDFRKGFTGVRKRIEEGKEIENVYELF